MAHERSNRIRAWRVCVVTGADVACGRSHLDVARAAAAGGAGAVQLRAKDADTRELLALARELIAALRPRGVALIVNDRVDVAIAADADGVHLGPDDLPPDVARRLLGPGRILGVSARTAAGARAAVAAGADYLGVGPIREARGTKPDAPAPVGPVRITELRRIVSIPILAIGGIDAASVPAAIEAGADGVAVVSAVSGAEDMVAATVGIVAAVRKATKATRRRAPAE